MLTPLSGLAAWGRGKASRRTADLQTPRGFADHLRNPQEFWGEYVLPTVARNDPKFDPDTMWRGPVWANVNYFFVEALQQIHERDLASALREKTLDMIMANDSIYEYYNSETGVPPQKAANIFGWTAAVFIDLALQAASENESQETVRE